jgi:hypothetical protein
MSFLERCQRENVLDRDIYIKGLDLRRRIANCDIFENSLTNMLRCHFSFWI